MVSLADYFFYSFGTSIVNLGVSGFTSNDLFVILIFQVYKSQFTKFQFCSLQHTAHQRRHVIRLKFRQRNHTQIK
jgi:hypothetical protein